MKRAYYYLFYKFYKMSEAAPSRWLSDWKAGIAIIVLELFLISSLFIYYKVFVNRYVHLGESNWDVIISVLVVIIPNYFAFVHTDVWKEYIKEFDQLPKRKNRIGSWIVFGVVLFVIANLIFSFYLMSQIDWSQYR
jgi:succinate dehydrogenase hydrophobic anchor subunit